MNKCCLFVPIEVRALKLLIDIVLLLVLRFGLISTSHGHFGRGSNFTTHSHGPPSYDYDNDGYHDSIDCDPDNPDIGSFHAGRDDYGDGVDNNCDGADGHDWDEDTNAGNVPALDQSIYPTVRDCNDDDDRISPRCLSCDDSTMELINLKTMKSADIHIEF